MAKVPETELNTILEQIKNENLSYDQLSQAIRAIEEKQQEVKEKSKASAKEKIEEILTETGLTLSEIYPDLGKPSAASGGTKKETGSRGPATKYAHPDHADNPDYQHSLRGRTRPDWFIALADEKGVSNPTVANMKDYLLKETKPGSGIFEPQS